MSIILDIWTWNHPLQLFLPSPSQRGLKCFDFLCAMSPMVCQLARLPNCLVFRTTRCPHISTYLSRTGLISSEREGRSISLPRGLERGPQFLRLSAQGLLRWAARTLPAAA